MRLCKIRELQIFLLSCSMAIALAQTALAAAADRSGSASKSSSTTASTAAPTITQLMADLGFKPELEQHMRNGRVLTAGMPEMENTDRELAASAVMLVVRRPLAEVIEAYMDGEVFRINEKITDWHEIDWRDANGNQADAESLDAELALLGYIATEKSEAKKLLKAQPGDSFNLAAFEMEQIKKLRNQGDAVTLASNAYRTILTARLHAYLDDGLEGIAPYERKGGKQIRPDKDISIAVNSFGFLDKNFPEFKALLTSFPKDMERETETIEHRFYWLKQLSAERSQFVLAHHMAELQDQYAVIVEQQYYVGHSYNTMVALIGCVPYENGTVVFYTNRFFTDQITGFASGTKRNIGRERLEKTVSTFLEKLRTELEKPSSQSASDG